MSKEIKELREKQNEIVHEARQLIDSITDDTEQSAAKEIEEKYDRAMADFDKIEADISRREKVEAAEKRINERGEQVDLARRPGGGDTTRSNHDDGADDVMSAEDAFKVAVRFGAAAVPAEHRGLIKHNRELPPEIRAQAVGTDSAGGYVVPEGFQAEIVKSMAAWGPMLDPSVTRVLNTATGNQIPWPTINDTSNVGALLAENTAEGEQDATFGEKVLNAYKYSSDIIRVSMELLQDSAFNIDQLIAELFGERLGRISNTALTTGTGSSQPNGIVTASSAGKTAASATAITFDEIIDLFHSVDPAYRASPSCRFMFNDSTLSAIRKLKDGDGNYLWQAADGRAGEPAAILGRGYVINQAMDSIATAKKTVLFGDMNKYVVRRVRDFTLLRLAERYAEYYQVGFLAFNRLDGELLDTAAVKHLVQA